MASSPPTHPMERVARLWTQWATSHNVNFATEDLGAQRSLTRATRHIAGELLHNCRRNILLWKVQGKRAIGAIATGSDAKAVAYIYILKLDALRPASSDFF